MEEEVVIYLITTCFLSCLVVIILIIVVLHKVQRERIRKEKEIYNAVFKAQNEEQKRVGQDLHDDVGPLMASIYNRLELVLSKAEFESGNNLVLKEIQQEVRQTSDQIRKASHDLIPIDFSQLTFSEALEDAVCELGSNDIKVRFHATTDAQYLSDNQKFHLVKITKELVHNAVKHSGGNMVEVRLFTEPGLIKLHVVDNGLGFSKSKNEDGIGITNIKSRLKLIRGEMSIETSEPSGTKIEVLVRVK